MKDILKFGSRGSDIRVLQTQLNTLGENLLTDGIFGDATFSAVCDFQTVYKLEPDGVVGPKTWLAIEGALARKRLEDAKPKVKKRYTDADLKHAGEHAVELALHWWKRDVYDPKADDTSDLAKESKQAITYFIHEGLGWTWEPPYAGDGDFEWCLAFVSKVWGRLKPAIRALCIASTYRVDRYGAYRTIFGETPDTKPADGGRLRAVVDGNPDVELPFEPRPGDILLVGRKSYGTHGCIVESYDPETRTFLTLEGNAYGIGPHSERQQGVVKGSRDLEEVRRIIRPGVDDLDE